MLNKLQSKSLKLRLRLRQFSGAALIFHSFSLNICCPLNAFNNLLTPMHQLPYAI